MALQAGTIWEVRTTGNNANGGGWYDAGGASVDYSEQDAPELSVADAVTDGTTTVTSATGGFTAAMLGSIVNIVTKGRFEIKVVTDGNTITIDRTATAGSGLTANVGGAVADLEEIDAGVVLAGNTLHIKAGTYTASGAIAFAAGNSLLPINVYGYNSSRGDEPTGDNRPLYEMGNNGFNTSTYNRIENIRFTTAHSSGISIVTCSVLRNCRVHQTGGSGAVHTYEGFYLTNFGARLIDCEAISDYGSAIVLLNDTAAVFCYAHDSYIGIEMGSSSLGSMVAFNIIDTCSYRGISIGIYNCSRFLNNTIYNCGFGIHGTSGYGHLFLNNRIEDNTTGASWTNDTKTNLWDFNNWFNNGSDVSNVTKGDNATANDPGYANAAGGDFSEVDDADAFSIRLGVG